MPPRRRTRLPAALAVVAAVLVAGCGAERTPPPDVVTPAAPAGARIVGLPAAGVAFRAPANWAAVAPADTLAGGVQSGTATLAVWRYPRTERLPAAGATLRAAQRRLVAQVRARGDGVRVDSRRATTVAGAPAVVLTTTQTVAGSPRRYRSVHVFARGAEIVLDASAPPDEFGRVDRTVFRPAVRSLRLSEPRA